MPVSTLPASAHSSSLVPPIIISQLSDNAAAVAVLCQLDKRFYGKQLFLRQAVSMRFRKLTPAHLAGAGKPMMPIVEINCGILLAPFVRFDKLRDALFLRQVFKEFFSQRVHRFAERFSVREQSIAFHDVARHGREIIP